LEGAVSVVTPCSYGLEYTFDNKCEIKGMGYNALENRESGFEVVPFRRLRTSV